MRLTLTHPPLDDPTLPYHSTAYLAGHLMHNGFHDVEIRDTNVEFVNWALEEEVFASFHDQAQGLRASLERKPSRGFEEQERYFTIWAQPEIYYPQLQKAVRGMREMEPFLDWREYRDNVNILLRYFGFLGALAYPAEISNFRQMSRGRFSSYNLNDLFDADLGRQVCLPFARYLEERLAYDGRLRETDVLGISVVYDHQLFHALHFARWWKSRWPERPVLMGGTAISQLYKYLKDTGAIRRFFELCDGLVVGEGETASCQLADRDYDVAGARDIRNLITFDSATSELHLPSCVHYENVRTLGRPKYDYDWDLYLAPARGINYAPTRGCYWNRCTFCDYGLNTDKPTSPWREREVPEVIEDLREAVEHDGVRYVYFAVDVMSPSYLGRLSDAILDSGLDIRWSAELRMEKVFSRDRCRQMAKAGCVCVSFGMESGSQKILDLIDKGTRVEYMGATMQHFAESDIAVQLMTFEGFPGESPEEKQQTIRFIEEHDPFWAAGGLGTFLLTGTAIVAKDPERFGVRLVETEDADIARAITFELENGERETVDPGEALESRLTEDLDGSFDSDGGVFPAVLGRPWAGGTDTLHTMIYYRHHGRFFFREHRPRGKGLDVKAHRDETLLSAKLFLPGHLRSSPFDVSRLIENRQDLARHLTELAKV
ncbi:MAG: radical SAM protein, partial [Holophagales bacterium]|nr:radical SAM protein [Holophagales bacterium]